MTKKIVLYLFIAGLISVVVTAGVLYYQHRERKASFAQKCPHYDPEWEDLYDCLGVISIRKGWDSSSYYIQDDAHRYLVAQVENPDYYKVSEGKFYIRSQEAIPCTVQNETGTKWCQRLYNNGQLSDKYYQTEDEIPKYFIVDYNTGEASSYKSLKDIPPDQQHNFQ